MSKIVLDEITSGYQLSKVNENFQRIEDELNNRVLYRNAPDGEANTVEKDIDLNGKKLYNVGDIQFQGFDSLEDLLERTTTAAEESEASKDAAEVAAENAAISAAAASTYTRSAVVRTFSGDGSTVAFNLTATPRTKENTQVHIGSVYQRKSTYSVTDNILTFNTAPPAGTNNIEVVIFESVFVSQSGYTIPVAYSSGIVLSQYNQLVEYNDEFYKLKAGQAPYTTTGTWETDSAKLVTVGDAALRQELAAGDGAEKVGYQVTGGVVRDVAGKLGEFVSVKDFGAVGDGVTDDTAAIQAAIDGVNAVGGGVLFIPGGVYLVKNLSLKGNIRYLGSGRASVLRSHPSCISGDVLAKTTSQSNIIVDGVVFDGNKGTVAGTTESGTTLLQLNGGVDIAVKNCRFQNNEYLAIALVGVDSFYCSFNSFYDTDCGVIVLGNYPSNNIEVIGNIFELGTSEGVSVWASDTVNPTRRVNIVGNTFLSKVVAVQLRRCHGFSVDSNIMSSCTTGVNLMSDSPACASGSIRSNHLREVSNGFSINSASSIVLSGNTVTDVMNNAVWVTASKDVVTTDNILSDYNKATNDAAGIRASGACSNVIIRGNRIFDTRIPVKNYAGIQIQSGCNLIYISDNIVTEATHKILLQSGATNIRAWGNDGTIIDQAISGSIIRDNIGGGTVDIVASSATVTLSPHKGDHFRIAASTAQTISTITASVEGRVVTLKFNDNRVTINNTGNISLAGGAFTSAANATITLVYSGSKWYELSRSTTNA